MGTIARGLFIPYIPKWVPTFQVWRHGDVIIKVELKIANFQWNIGHNWKFRLNVQKYRNFAKFLAYKRRKCHLYSKFQDHTTNIFFFWFSHVATTPSTRHLWRLTLPPGYPRFFFIKMTTNVMTQGHFLYGFRTTGNHLLDGGNHPIGKTRVNLLGTQMAFRTGFRLNMLKGTSNLPDSPLNIIQTSGIYHSDLRSDFQVALL